MADPYEEDIAPPMDVYKRLTEKARGNSVMGSTLALQAKSEGSKPSSPTTSRWDLLASDCLHKVTQKCLFYGGKWRSLCLSCGKEVEKESPFPLSW